MSPTKRKPSRLSRVTGRYRLPRLEVLEPRLPLTTGYGVAFQLFTDDAQLESGLVGTYVDQNLRAVDELDWRATQLLAGQRVDELFFPTNSFGSRAAVGITGGTDEDWDQFSVQWDGVVEILEDETRLATRSDDGSRFWIDINRNSVFENDELFDNGWGTAHGVGVETSELTPPLSTGSYPIRAQFEEGISSNTMSLVANPPTPGENLTVRVAYVIPSNRMQQPTAEENLQDFIPRMAEWYAEQMDRFGFGRKTFRFETEADGVTPKINVVHVGVDDAFIRKDTWGHTIAAASAVGVDTWAPGTVWLMFPESHVQNSDGSIEGGVALGGGFGSGSDGGIAMMGSATLFRSTREALSDDNQYDGQTVPEIGPYPLVDDVSFPWFEFDTFSSIASSSQGATAHELGHAFGLPHDFRNDDNFHGNLMGNGLRGFRGATLPDTYPQDDTRLSYSAALILNSSRYFQRDQFTSDAMSPSISFNTTGTIEPIDGLLRIEFTASDDVQLSSAMLRRNGENIAELPLSGTSVTTSFTTPFYEPGNEDEYTVVVYDTSGNRVNDSALITPSIGFNQAPQPSLRVNQSLSSVGDTVTLDATRSVDPDGATADLVVEWDLDGDGTFDVGPFDSLLYETGFEEPGTRRVIARLTDLDGAQSISTPIALRVIDEPTQLSVRQAATLLVEGTVETTSSFVVSAEGPRKLDAWIDFNGDEDWDDDGEQVSLGVDVLQGENLITVKVPADAITGEVDARFRLTSGGGSLPDDPTSYGLVGDYTVELVDGQLAADVFLRPMTGYSHLAGESDYLVAHHGAAVMFHAPEDAIQSIRFDGTEGDDTLALGPAPAFFDGAWPFHADLGGGFDTVMLGELAADLPLNSSAPDYFLDVEKIDVRGHGPNRLELDHESVLSMTNANDVLQVFADPDDDVSIGDDWTLGVPTFIDDVYFRRVEGGSLLLHGPAHWQNPIESVDVTGDGTVAPIDVLALINTINAGSFADPLPPPTIDELPPHYLDPTGDGKLTPVDVLKVVNFINAQVGVNSAGGEFALSTSDTGFQDSPAENDLDSKDERRRANVESADSDGNMIVPRLPKDGHVNRRPSYESAVDAAMHLGEDEFPQWQFPRLLSSF